MKITGRVVTVGSLTLLAVGTVALPTQAFAASGELLSNGGFESGLSGWSCTAGSAVTTPVHSGSAALAGATTASNTAQCVRSVSVQPNTSYTLSGFLRGNYVYLGEQISGSSTWTSAADYSKVSVPFTTGASQTTATIYVHGWYGQGTYFADDLSLTGPAGSVSVPTAPGTPSVTGVTTSTVSLSWPAPAGPVTSYVIYRGGTQVGTSTGTTFTDTGLSADTAYNYTVRAVNSAGQSPASAAAAARTTSTASAAPAAPSGLRTTATTSTSIALAWTAPSGQVTGYDVYRGTSKVGSPTAASFTDGGLSAGTTYSYTVRARNSAGTSPSSGTLSATTQTSNPGTGTGPAAQLPRHMLTGYWQNFDNGATPLRLSAVPASYDLIAVAFADADPATRGAVTFNIDPGLSSALGGYTNSQFAADIATAHSHGQKVIISVGGQNGTITVNDATSASSFATSINNLISAYGFDGVDIDLENGVDPTYMAQALRQVDAAHPGSIITMAPQTIDMLSPTSDYFALALNIKDILTVVNTQFYNSGSMPGCDGQVYSQGGVDFATTQACTQITGGLNPSQIGLGFPASTKGAGSGFVSPTVVNGALTCLTGQTGCGHFTPTQVWPTLRGAMTWSINWDAANNYQFANSVSAQLHRLP